MVSVAVRIAPGQEIVLAPVAALDALGHLKLLGPEAAHGHAGTALVAARAGDHVDIAGDVVEAVARVIGAAHDLDGLDVQREDSVQKGHAPGDRKSTRLNS